MRRVARVSALRPTLAAAAERWRGLLGWLLVALILLFWARSLTGVALAPALRRMAGQPGLLALALLSATLAPLGPALLWQAITRWLAAPLPRLAATRGYLLSDIARYLPGSLWHFAGRVYVSRQAGIPTATATAILTTEQTFSLFAGLLLMGLTQPLWPAGTPPAAVPALRLLPPMALILMHPRLYFPLMNLAIRVGRQGPLATRFSARHSLTLLALYGATLIVGLLPLLLALLAMGVPAAAAPQILRAGIPIWLISTLSIPTPGGLGTREAATTWLLGPLVGVEVAAAGAVAWRLIASAGEAAALLAAEALWRLQPPVPRAVQEDETSHP